MTLVFDRLTFKNDPSLALYAGFGSALGHVTLDAAQPYGIRQLAAVILKNYVRTHWQEGTRGFAPPEVGEEEKAYVRNLLPRGIADPDSKIRTAVGMAVARVAEHDWPHAWPELTPILVNLIRHRESPAHGAVRGKTLRAHGAGSKGPLHEAAGASHVCVRVL